jgi:hypothetical protein
LIQFTAAFYSYDNSTITANNLQAFSVGISISSFNGVFASLLITTWIFIFFPESSLKKLAQIEIFRIFEPLVDFKFNFEVYNLGQKTFKKLSLHGNSKERKRKSFLKAFTPKLSTSKLNLNSTSGSKILKIWIQEAFSMNF